MGIFRDSPEQPSSLLAKSASNSYSRDGKAKVIKAIGLLKTLNE
mgnify:CR=1 FL=1